MKFTWIPFYKELSNQLLNYKNKRSDLVSFIYDDKDGLGEYTHYLHKAKKEDKIDDIDPFSFFGIFNTSNKRNVKIENRRDILLRIKKYFQLKSDVPSDFKGISILNYSRSFYYDWNNIKTSCDILWRSFEDLQNGNNLESFFNYYKFSTRKAEVTMPLYWMRPDDFIALDSQNVKYLKNKYDIDTKDVVDYKTYLKFMEKLKGMIKNKDIKEKSFYEISANAAGDATTDCPSWEDDIVKTWRNRKNIVLYGAPGSGKTYEVPELVVRLCFPDFNANDADRIEIMERYNQLKQEKRVAFTTFHQSMDYEDWMEGLRPEVDEESRQVKYDVEPGIFKRLCDNAERPIVKDKKIGIADDAVVWKVSLAGTGDNPVRSECMKNNHIRIGWDDYGPVISDETNWDTLQGRGKQILDAFINKMKVGDIVMSCYSASTIDAIGVVASDYEYIDTYKEYKRVRKVNWLLKGVNENIVSMNEGKTLTLGTVYRLNAFSLDKVKSLLDKYKKPATMEDNTQPYVMVIDEMNRGNVSKIFGEMITLLETDKRKGMKNAESVILPYSKSIFQIPSNVFIIATMNTADKSLGTLDYAIRRRFAFVCVMPCGLEDVAGFNMELFEKVSRLFINNFDDYRNSKWAGDFKLERADTLSEEFRPEDVWIGQSYFLMTDDDNNDNTRDRLNYEIIPLLEEYVNDGVLTEAASKVICELRKEVD